MHGWFEVLACVAIVIAGVGVVRRFRLAGRTGLVILAGAMALFLLAMAVALVTP